jgi:hypothetical protein
MVGRRCLVRSRKGCLKLASDTVQNGDTICILYRSSVPMILRRGGLQWVATCEAYVDGILDGEALEDLSAQVVKLNII